MMRFISFSSGSCGNCYLLLGPRSGIMIDAGVGIRRVKKDMDAVGLGMDSISAILITHDHGDHIRSLGSFCKRLAVPVWTTGTIHGALARHPFTKDWITPCRQVLTADVWNPITDDFEVQFFVVPHDATQCVGYAIRCGEEIFVLMTDMGHTTPEAMNWASQASTVVVESNYDMDMLFGGDYPEILKKRISHGAGHLSNEDCAKAIAGFLHPGLRNIFLCHLSGNNNTPQLAYDNAAAALEACGVQAGTIALRVLHRGVVSPLLNL
ncbi:MAG: MBL fold metallo-hydrolase [Bacteroidales bacterium]|nr:MBL fold metallo-hydrolase [Bacteroidales bacterium]